MSDAERKVQPMPTLQDYMEAACLPFLLTANWWTVALLDWLPPSRREMPFDNAQELAVPPTVEEEGERALFA